MNNKQIAAFLKLLADYLELTGANAFRVNAYRRSARAVENQRIVIRDHLDELETISGIGKGTAATIREWVKTGQSSILDECKAKLPPGLPALLQIPGLGAKSIATLYRELGVNDLASLKEAAEAERIRTLSGFGPKKEEKILAGIEALASRREAFLLSEAQLVADMVKTLLDDQPIVERVEIAGSLRRRKVMVKDLDFVVATTQPVEVQAIIVDLPIVTKVINKGERKVTVRLRVEEIEIDADFRLVQPAQFASAWHHFTGSKEHNIRIRQRGKELGWKVNEYGLTHQETGERKQFADEETFFAYLGLSSIPPALREDRGEIEKALQGDMPTLIQQKDIRADLHMHTLYSDGAESIRTMAEAARARGYDYIAITDHSRSLRVANGLSIEDLYEQWQEIDRLNEELEGITLLKGIEMDILADATLDYPDEILQEMDWVIAAIHSAFRQDEKTIMKRLRTAMENPYVDLIAHPTGRLLGRRPAYAVNMEELLHLAKETGTALECNANPHRLDLDDHWLRRAADEGIWLSINTDAHSLENMALISYGVDTAQRAWLQPQHVLNTYSWEEWRKRRKRHGG